MNSKFISVAASAGLLLAATIWGYSFVTVKDSLDYIGPMYMIAYRYTIAALAMSLIFLKKWKLLNKDYLLQGIFTGSFLFLAYVTQTIGCDYTTAGKNAFLTTVYVIFIPFITWILSRKRPRFYVFIAAFMSITGIGFLALGSEDAGGLNVGDILTIICGIFFALHIIFTEKFNHRGGDPLFLTLLQFVFTAIFGWITAPVFDGAFPVSTAFTGKVVGSMMYLGLLSTMVGFSLQNLGLKYVQSSIASLFLSFESVFGILFSTLILHEVFTLKMLLGCTLIFLAVILAENGWRLFRERASI
jgi:drug/metabolite transporter (DMT)-like permease